MYTKAPKGQTKLRDNTKNNSPVSLKAQPINGVQHGQRANICVHSTTLPKDIHESFLGCLSPGFNVLKKFPIFFFPNGPKYTQESSFCKLSSRQSVHASLRVSLLQWNASPILSQKEHKQDATTWLL